ncbi:MAG: hypothetical protein LBB30_03315 [Candidatus Methanoplasma sp.]|jgi:hypothetical protein|nr:hypothetical protein [Candidatus Methanoplasma sp.]
MAGRQPRDSRGRWTKYIGRKPKIGKLVVADEGRVPGGKPPASSKEFIMAAAVTDRWDEFETIADAFDKNTQKGIASSPNELKYKTSDDDTRIEVLEEIAKLKPSIHAIIVHKDDLPPDWEGLGGYDIYRKTTANIIEDVMRDTDGDLTFYFDQHTALDEKPEIPFPDNRFLVRAVEEKTDPARHNVREVSQKNSVEEKTLQTNDFIVGSIKSRHVFGDRSPYDRIEDLVQIREIRR